MNTTETIYQPFYCGQQIVLLKYSKMFEKVLFVREDCHFEEKFILHILNSNSLMPSYQNGCLILIKYINNVDNCKTIYSTMGKKIVKVHVYEFCSNVP